MTMLNVQLSAANPAETGTPLLAIALMENPSLAGIAAIDTASSGALARTFEMKDFRGGRDETLHLTGIAKGPRRLLLVGMGAVTDKLASLKRAASLAARQAQKLGVGELVFYAGQINAEETEAVTAGLIAGAWEYNELKSATPESEARKPLERATILTSNTDDTRRGLSNGQAVGSGQSLARRLAMMPGNLCTPEYLAQVASELAAKHNLELTVMGRAELEAEAMGSFLAVAQGTPQDPKLITLRYQGGANDANPVT